MRAFHLGAFRVKVERVFLNDKPAFPGDSFLAPFDFLVTKFFNAAAIDTHQMVVVLSGLNLENGLA